MRPILVIALLALLAACGRVEQEKPCCAIEPKAKCESALYGAGVTDDEMRLLRMTNACPGPRLSEARIREIAEIGKTEACKGMMISDMALHGLETPGLCKPEPGLGVDDKNPGIPTDSPETADCQVGLIKAKLTPKEMWVMLHTPEGICPNLGVTEARIREILAQDWEAAGCRAHTVKEMLNALDTHACGGDAG